jgi:hypothetical protein
MPLHEWSDRPGWEGMRHLWITESLRWIKPRLPVGYRAFIGSAPLRAVGAPIDRPDVNVRSWSSDDTMIEPGPTSGDTHTDLIEPD